MPKFVQCLRPLKVLELLNEVFARRVLSENGRPVLSKYCLGLPSWHGVGSGRAPGGGQMPIAQIKKKAETNIYFYKHLHPPGLEPLSLNY